MYFDYYRSSSSEKPIGNVAIHFCSFPPFLVDSVLEGEKTRFVCVGRVVFGGCILCAIGKKVKNCVVYSLFFSPFTFGELTSGHSLSSSFCYF